MRSFRNRNYSQTKMFRFNPSLTVGSLVTPVIENKFQIFFVPNSCYKPNVRSINEINKPLTINYDPLESTNDTTPSFRSIPKSLHKSAVRRYYTLTLVYLDSISNYNHKNVLLIFFYGLISILVKIIYGSKHIAYS